MSGIPIGTFLSKVHYNTKNEGKLPEIAFDDVTQPFHLGVLKAKVGEGDEYMCYQVSTYPQFHDICGALHGMFMSYMHILGEPPTALDSNGLRAAFRLNKTWNCLFIIVSTYRYPKSYLIGLVNRISAVSSTLFTRPSYAAAQFAQKSLTVFSKSMCTMEGITSVLANYKLSAPQRRPILTDTDSVLAEVGTNQLIMGVVDDQSILDSCSIFVFGRLLYTTMEFRDILVSELLTANLNETTAERETVDHRLFCLARHYHTVMVSITEPGRGLERCCAMQVALMKLDAQGVIVKMQQSFAKKLPPPNALDVLVVAGPYTVTQPPFIEVPLFAQSCPQLRANAVAALMYEQMSRPGLRCVVNYILEKLEYQVKFMRHGDTMTFTHAYRKKPIDDKEVIPIPHLLKAIHS